MSGPTDSEPPRSVSSDRLDELFSTLADEHRRQVLHYFLEAPSDVATFNAVAAHVAATDDMNDINRLVTALYHHHLPKLADAGLVEYDVRSETVRYQEHPLVSRYYRLLTGFETDE